MCPLTKLMIPFVTFFVRKNSIEPIVITSLNKISSTWLPTWNVHRKNPLIQKCINTGTAQSKCDDTIVWPRHSFQIMNSPAKKKHYFELSASNINTKCSFASTFLSQFFCPQMSFFFCQDEISRIFSVHESSGISGCWSELTSDWVRFCRRTTLRDALIRKKC